MIPQQGSLLPWTQPGWLDQATAWVRAELDRENLHLLGPIEQPHIRPWSTVLRAPISSGDVYFKAVPPLLKHEVAVTEALARWRPDCIPHIRATDLERGWMLMSDSGTRLRDIIRPTQDISPWLDVLPLYAKLQIEMSSHLEALFALGAPDRSLAILPSLYELLLGDREILRIDRTHGLTSREYERLLDLTPRLTELCGELAKHSIPESLHHGDLHDGNIFRQHDRYIFFDWGDCSITHPFFSFRTVMVSNENSLGLAENAPEHEHLRDVFLEPWMHYESRDQLLAAFMLAQRLWMIPTALTWHRILANSDAAARETYAEPIPALLQEFLSAQGSL
jgi:hypothetical protein